MLRQNMKTIARFIMACAALSPFQAFAQNGSSPAQLSPVTITGPTVSAIPQSSTSAAAVVSGEEVQVGEMTSVRDLTAQTPSLTVFDGNNQRSPRFSMRGFRENNFVGGEPVVGLYVDGVPYFDMNSRGLALFDVREIQFVRGEQGALYGASGVGGVINVLTAQPQNQTRGYIEGSYGNYNAQNYQVGISGALVTNKLFFGVNGLDTLRDGFVYNNFDHDHPDDQNTLGLRGVLKWTPSDPWEITLMADAGRDNDGFVPTYLPGSDSSAFDVSRNVNGYVHTDNLDEALKIGYAAGSVLVTSVLTHRNWAQNAFQEIPPSANETVGSTSPRLDQWTEELRVESPDPEAVLKWRAGLYYSAGDLLDDSGNISPSGDYSAVSESKSDTYALFGQGTYTPFEKLDLTAGLRLTYDYRNLELPNFNQGFFYSPTSPVNSAKSSDVFTSAQPKLAAAWHFTPALEAYASAAEGYQSGGFNSSAVVVGYPFPASPPSSAPVSGEYSPERDWQFEAGAKSSWLGNKLSVNASIFYTVADNYQTYAQQTYMLNAHRADLYGAELELTARPIKDLDLSVGAGYTDARYSRFTEPAAASLTGSPVDLNGKAISFVPEFTANASARYRLPWYHLYVHGEIIGVGRYHLDDSYDVASGPVTQDAYCLVNAQFGYESKHFQIYFFAKNIFDTHYYNNALNLGYASLVLQPGDPATYGIAATARF
jgi:iron complex outermembrane receptor protein